jgi:hypothetical protein
MTDQETAYEIASADVVLPLSRDEANTLVEVLNEAIEREQESDELGHAANYLGALKDKILATEGVH